MMFVDWYYVKIPGGAGPLCMGEKGIGKGEGRRRGGGEGDSRRDGVDSDVVFCTLVGCGAAQADHGVLSPIQTRISARRQSHQQRKPSTHTLLVQ